MRESDCLAEHDSFPRMCLLSQPGPRYLVRGWSLLQAGAPAFTPSFRRCRKAGRRYEVQSVISNIVIALLVVIILVFVALRFV
jgi:hypothetical protein